MKARRAMLIASAAAIALLAVLAIVGAFLGAERAAVLFNSPPAAALWAVLGVLTAAGGAMLLVRRRFGWAAAHAGAALVVAGGMLGSPAGHRAAGRLTGRSPVRDGVMVLPVGGSSDYVMTGEGFERLPFTVTVRDAWTEYYDPPSVVILEAGQTDEAVGRLVPDLGQGVLALEDGTTIRVVEHLSRATGAYADDVIGALAVTAPDDSVTFIEAVPGREVHVGAAAVTVRIVEVFANPRVSFDDGIAVVDPPGPRTNPALRVEMTRPDGTTSETIVFARADVAPPPRLPEGLELSYPLDLLAEGPIAVADPSSRHPAVRVEVARGDRRRCAWLLADPQWKRQTLTASNLPEFDLGGRRLQIAQRTDRPADYRTRLAITRDSRTVAEGTIEVNRPLHYGGFHLYQTAFDEPDPAGAVLRVHSDLGVSVAWAGFALLGAGLTWAAWIAPLRRR
ncbi:MAG: cytochrome c biogenesis protein ResB [Planctomycetes bacterium]|nr:cytochrome c biogenesis protein ResB [Planctomycetota bacterium]